MRRETWQEIIHLKLSKHLFIAIESRTQRGECEWAYESSQSNAGWEGFRKWGIVKWGVKGWWATKDGLVSSLCIGGPHCAAEKSHSSTWKSHWDGKTHIVAALASASLSHNFVAHSLLSTAQHTAAKLESVTCPLLGALSTPPDPAARASQLTRVLSLSLSLFCAKLSPTATTLPNNNIRDIFIRK